MRSRRSCARPMQRYGSTTGYLDGDAVIAAAKTVGAEAVHPGYGFLSENAAFAQSVMDAGLVWVGPPPAVIASMGDKLAAKRLAIELGVPPSRRPTTCPRPTRSVTRCW